MSDQRETDFKERTESKQSERVQTGSELKVSEQLLIESSNKESLEQSSNRSTDNQLSVPQLSTAQLSVAQIIRIFRTYPAFFLLLLVLFWSYRSTFAELSQLWIHDPQYSHGILIPLFSFYLLYLRRDQLVFDDQPSYFFSWAIIFFGLGMRIVAGMLSFLPLDGLSFILVLFGGAGLLCGRKNQRVSFGPILFLIFMIPLPYQMQKWMGEELQTVATLVTTNILQTLGQPALADGNIILLDEVKLEVANACSGLRMLMTFIAFAVATVLVIQRCWVVKLLILVSSIPIALVVNILRIVATGIAHVQVPDMDSRESILKWIHDFNGWLMMPVGLSLLMLELYIYKHLLIETKNDELY